MRKPDFFIVGAPKCATSSFYDYLREHPDIYMPARADMHFFADDFSDQWDRIFSLENYERHFRGARDRHAAVGERSVYYLYSQVALPKLKRYNPGARLIAMLRSPLDLALSFHSQLQIALNEDVEDFETAWRLQPNRLDGERIPSTCKDPQVLQYGRIAMLGEQVRRMLDLFPREQVHFIFVEDLKRSTLEEYKRALEFLGVPYDGRTNFPHQNVRKAHKSKWLARLVLRQPRFIKAITAGIKRLLRIEQTGLGVALINLNTKPVGRQQIPDGLRRELIDFFADDVGLLANLTGRDLSHWLRE